ncbi:MAG: hypothetical protein KME21_23645 [Desmonostoc vinosum HA7617-LM4]|nr:hypothetical protein [Desmonostoc vinosum HA7617-LM4]
MGNGELGMGNWELSIVIDYSPRPRVPASPSSPSSPLSFQSPVPNQSIYRNTFNTRY